MNEIKYEQKQKKWIKTHNLKVGDKIRIIRSFENHEMGETCGFLPEMNSHIGKIEKIRSLYGDVLRLDDEWSWPYFVLKPIKYQRTYFKDSHE